MGLYIGLNGCSLKTEENLVAARAVPLDRLMVETDAPWCSVTSTHASAKFLPATPLIEKVKPEKFVEGKGVKGRNEPAEVVTIAHVLAGVRNEPLEELAAAVYANTLRLFFPGEK